MTAFVSESPATYDQLPLSSCSPPYLAYFLRQILMCFFPPLTPYFPPSCHLCSQVFSSFVTSIPLFFPPATTSTFYLPTMFDQFSLFCHKGVLEWLQAIWSKSEIYVQSLGLLSLPGSPVTTATGLLTVFIIDSAVSFSGYNLSSLQNSFFFLIFSLCLRKFLLSFQHYRRTAYSFCMSILKSAYPSFVRP